MKYVGTSQSIHDAAGKVAGAVRYAGDINLPHMVHLCLVRSSIPHGYIRSVHTEKALAVPGVYGVFHCFNTTERKFNRYRAHISHELPQEERAFADYVRFLGDRVAAVAACDADAARRAASLVEVEYEELPFTVGFDDTLSGKNCLEGEAPVRDEFLVEDGECPNTEDLIEVETFSEIPRIHHAAMEPHACVADYDPYEKQLTVYSPNQSVHGIRTVLTDYLQMPFHRVRVVKTTMGGSFGAKQEWFVEPVTALVSTMLKRPVKLVYNRAEAMVGAYVRGAMRATLKSRFKPDGTLVSLDADILLDAGAYISNSSSYIRALYGRLFRCYRMSHTKYRGRVISSNTPVAGGFRGWSGPEAAIFMEHHMDSAAKKLRIDPTELRLKNARLPGETDENMGISLEDIRIQEAILRGKELIRWDEVKEENRKFNEANQRYRRGVGIGCGGLGSSYYPVHPESGEGWMSMNEDGTVRLKITAHDHGCGTVTMLKMIAAEVLDMDINDIALTEGDTDNSPLDIGCYSSRTTFILGRTAYETAQAMKNELLAAASELYEVPVAQLYLENGSVCRQDEPGTVYPYGKVSADCIVRLRRNLSARAQYKSDTNPGVTGAHFAHVEVDTWTGLTKVLDYVAVQDIGQPINSAMCIAQIQGAAQMGCGAALRESVTVGADGRCTDSLSRYHLCLAPDLPEIRVELLTGGRSQDGPFGAKSVGEVCYVPTAPAVCGAVNDALDSEMGVLPFTPDAILNYLAKERNR